MKSKQVGALTDTNNVQWSVWRKSCCCYTLTSHGRRVQIYDPTHAALEARFVDPPLHHATADAAVGELLAAYGIVVADGALV